MRKMLNTLFVTTEDAYLSLENENIVSMWARKSARSIPC